MKILVGVFTLYYIYSTTGTKYGVSVLYMGIDVNASGKKMPPPKPLIRGALPPNAV